jgi:excinuclease ABC subunit C
MLDANGLLIYVGKAKSLRSRLLSYFRTKSRDPKAGRIIANTHSIVWECRSGEFAALLRELELIRRWRPRFNVQGQPRRRRHWYVCLGRKPAPYVFLSSRPVSTALACFGPVPPGMTARTAVSRLNDAFRLRDCPQKQTMTFADQGELFPSTRAAGCLRHEIGTCLAPCAAACTLGGYMEQVNTARAFLTGENLALLDSLRRDMEAAAAEFAFERAAAVRDRLESLSWLSEHLKRLRKARDGESFIYPARNEDGSQTWYLIHGGRVIAARPAPRCPATGAAVADLIESVYARSIPPGGALAANEVDAVMLVAAWFRKHPAERERVFTSEQALAECRSQT